MFPIIADTLFAALGRAPEAPAQPEPRRPEAAPRAVLRTRRAPTSEAAFRPAPCD